MLISSIVYNLNYFSRCQYCLGTREVKNDLQTYCEVNVRPSYKMCILHEMLHVLPMHVACLTHLLRRHMLRKQILRLESKEMFLNHVKNIFVSQTQILLPKRMFPSLATQGNMSGNNVFATMFPNLARPIGPVVFQHTYGIRNGYLWSVYL